MSGDHPDTAGAGGVPPGFPVWKKLLFATVVVCGFFLLAEVVLLVAGVPTSIEREDPFRGFSGLIKIFQRDGELYRTKFSPATFNDQTFLAEKPSNGFRIFSLGGSSAYGFPWGAEAAFTAIVSEVLALGHPDIHVEAVNAGGVSYAMHRLNIVADELLEYKPDLFIIYSGHNEFIEPAFFEALKHRNVVRTRLEYLLARYSRLHSALQTALQKRRSRGAPAGDALDVSVLRDSSRIFSTEEKEAIRDEFRWRLERLVGRAQDAGVHVVLATVPCNLRDWRPEASTMSAGLANEDRRKWSELYARGKQRLEAKDFQSAKLALEQAARLDPGHAETHFLLGQACVNLRIWSEARLAFQRACDADSSPVRRTSPINEAIRNVGRKLGVAVVDMDRIFEDLSENGLVGYNLIEDYVHPTREGHEIIARYIIESIEASGCLGQRSDVDPAILDQVLNERRQRPMTKNATWFFNQGILLENQGNIEGAIEKFRQALEISPRYVMALANLGGLLAKTGHASEAAKILQQALEIRTDLPSSHMNLALALSQLERYEEAVDHFGESLRQLPENGEARNQMGVALERLGRLEEALVQHEEAVRLRPNFAPALRDLGLCLQKMGRSNEAISHFEKASILDPDNATAAFDLANVLDDVEGRSDQAIEKYREALRLNPEYSDAHCNLGVLLFQQGNAEEAIASFDRALAVDSNHVNALNNLGVVYMSTGELEKAASMLERALQINPDAANARQNLAKVRSLLQKQSGQR